MYDAIVVGARCAGSPTAMLLARKGYKVLLVDKASFPSDVISTHYIQPPGVARLENWGLLERLKATNCPAIHEIDFRLEGASFAPPAPAEDEPARPPATVQDEQCSTSCWPMRRSRLERSYAKTSR